MFACEYGWLPFLHVPSEAYVLLFCMLMSPPNQVGGHRWAGNLIIYPTGTWYGRVMPYHADCIVKECIVEGKVIKELWRGQLGWGKGGGPE
jgi:(2Fe-2S) ferredoxin